jgi:predicted O-methyltransferase YrrM
MKPIYLRNISSQTPELYDHPFLLEHFATWIKPENYLEIGVRHGTSLIPISKHARMCHAVDINFIKKDYADNIILYEMSSDEFFSKIQNIKFDMVFIDGDHSKEQVYKDFFNVKDKVIDDGFVFFHDTYPHNEEMLSASLSNNCWEAILRIKNEFHREWEIITLPFTPGVTIMKKMSLDKQLYWKP